MSSDYTQLSLWNVLEKEGTDSERAMVRGLIDVAVPVLDRIVETFPTYTVHNSTHAENVVRLMADLLGPRMEDLRPPEAAMLMLSAYYHDIGMVFRAEGGRSWLRRSIGRRFWRSTRRRT